MPEFLLRKLKNEDGAYSKIPYKVANSIGAMRGSRETELGKRMDRKHAEKISGRSAAKGK